MPPTEYPQTNPEPGDRRPLFPLGRVFFTPGALSACEEAQANPFHYLTRHITGDWGDLGDEDKAANDNALLTGDRVFSRYNLSTEERLWIITEADRASTTLLLPLEY